MEEQIKLFQSLLKNKETDEAVQLLASHPDLINATAEQGISLLLLAAYHKNERVLQYFLSHRSTLSIFEAIVSGDLDKVMNLLGKDPALLEQFSTDGFTPLGLASYFNHKSIVEFLIEHGADVNLHSNNGMKVAPLHSAVANKNLVVAKILLEHGADVNARQTLGVTPLHSAAHQGDIPMVQLLLQYKADMQAEMENGKKPLDIAKSDQNNMVIELLS